MKFFKRYYFLLSSLLFFLSFPSFDFFLFKGYVFFAWFFLVPLLLYIQDKNLKKVYAISFITGLFGFLFTYGWMGAFGDGFPGGQYIVLLFLIPCLTFFFAAKIFLAEFLFRRYNKLNYFIYPVIWLIIDLIKSLGFLAFPWTYLGYSQYQFESLIQLSSITGIFGITFLIMMSNILIFDTISYFKKNKFISFKVIVKNNIKQIIFCFVLLTIIISGKIYLITRDMAGKNGLRVSLIQSCISPWDDWIQNRFSFLEDLKKLTLKANKTNPDLIIWSESATLEPITFDYERNSLNPFELEVLRLAVQIKKPILTGEVGVAIDEGHLSYIPQNSAVLINQYGSIDNQYSKIHLCPFGEWFPYKYWLPSIQDILLKMQASMFYPGEKINLFNIKNYKFGNLICYEGMFFRLSRQYKRLGADFLVNITNDGWSDTYAGHMQHFSAAKFRAIENGIWFVRAGNTGFTTIINPYGQITKSIPILEKKFLTADLNFKLNHNTFYAEFGDIFLYFVIILLIIMLTYFEINVYNKKNIKD